MRARDLTCAALGWALAAATWIGASRLPRSLLSDEFGAEGLPRGLAVALAATSTLIALRAFWPGRGEGIAEASALGAARDHARAFGIVALGFGYVLLAPWLGYIPAAVLLIGATAWYYGARPSLSLLAVAVGGALFLWWIFARMLAVSMPAGFWTRLG